MSVYTVQEHEFPGTLAGLGEAVEVAAALASARPVQILKDGIPIDYTVPVQPRRPTRKGWHEWKSG
jgi:hypothetical protein